MLHWTGRSIFFGVFFAFITLMVLWLVWPYVNTVLFSVTVVVILSPLYNYFYRLSWGKGRALPTALTVIAFFFIIAIPVTLLLIVTWYQGKEFVADISREGFVLEDFLLELIQRVRQVPFLADFQFDSTAFQGMKRY